MWSFGGKYQRHHYREQYPYENKKRVGYFPASALKANPM